LDEAVRPDAIRPDARVAFGADTVSVTYGLFEVDLPAAWVYEHADVAAFLRGERLRHEVAPSREAVGVLELLDRQGCIVPPPLDRPLSLHELRDRFDRICSGWYAQYYQHPLWERLRAGRASRNELLAYVTHNYHVSRAAGVVAARMAVRGPARWRAFFAQDAREEFWHCDAYYFVQSAALGCAEREIARYVPLPASTAFEQHTLQLAEHDATAHLLVAYFQESSVMFRADADTFYDEVARAYGLVDFFEPWRAHIGIDVTEQHVAGLAALFDDMVIDPRAAERSLALTWAAFHFLCASLDHVVAEARADSNIVLRDPASLCRRGARPQPIGELASADIDRVIAAVADTALAALAASRGHDEIMIAGHIVEQLARHGGVQRLPRAPWTFAITSFLAEASVRPLEWAALVDRLAEWIALPIDTDLLKRSVAPDLAAIELGRFDELLLHWATATITFPDELCIK
jgi:hypothetical protein